jgi:hypothetical protein
MGVGVSVGVVLGSGVGVCVSVGVGEGVAVGAGGSVGVMVAVGVWEGTRVGRAVGRPSKLRVAGSAEKQQPRQAGRTAVKRAVEGKLNAASSTAYFVLVMTAEP